MFTQLLIELGRAQDTYRNVLEGFDKKLLALVPDDDAEALDKAREIRRAYALELPPDPWDEREKLALLADTVADAHEPEPEPTPDLA
jgi:hypothetical protein